MPGTTAQSSFRPTAELRSAPASVIDKSGGTPLIGATDGPGGKDKTLIVLMNCRRTDARSITTTYAYDALNRLTGKTYSDSTPPSTFSYGQTSVTIGSWSSGTLTNPKGRLTEAVTTSGGTVKTAVVYSYDTMGRPTKYWQCTPYFCSVPTLLLAQYSYDLAGDVQSWVHLARDNFTVTNTISAAQRVTAITASPNVEEIPQSLVPSATYTPWGALQTLQNGCYGTNCTTVQETYDYNNRMQPVRIQLGTASNNPANYCQVYDYYGVSPTSCTNSPTQATSGNNGNVRRYWYNDNVTSTYSHTAAYAYDNVNRLATAVATGSSAYNLTFDYTHDGSNGQYGNMHCTATQGVCNNTLTFSASTNRITTSGYTYDAAGNMTTDGTHSYTYQWDAEGRLTQAAAGGTTMHTYTCNALGQRAEDVPGNSLTPQELVYDPSGQLLGHFFNYPPQRDWWHIMVPALGRTMVDSEQWYVGNAWIYHYDALGSALQATDHTGAPLQDTLHYPWGQNWQGSWPTGIFAGLFSLQCQLDPCFDQSQTRDYPSDLGRWLSPDPLAGDISNPQSLNRYAYVLNNPTSLTDPTGLSDCGNTDYPCNNNGEPPPGGGHYNGNGGGTTIAGGASTDPSYYCSNLAENDASCGSYAGLWGINNGQSIYGPPQVGGWGDGGQAGIGMPGIGMPGIPDGFQQAGTGVLDWPPFLLHVDVWWPYIVAGATVCASNPYCAGGVAGVAAGVLVYGGVRAGMQIYQASQRGKGNPRDTGITDEAQRLVQTGQAPDVCAALDILMAAAKASGDIARQQRINTTKKGFGCRPSRQSR